MEYVLGFYPPSSDTGWCTQPFDIATQQTDYILQVNTLELHNWIRTPRSYLCSSWVAEGTCLNQFSVACGMAGVDDELTRHLEAKARSSRMDEWAGNCGVAQPFEPETEVRGQWGRSGRWLRGVTSEKGHS